MLELLKRFFRSLCEFLCPPSKSPVAAIPPSALKTNTEKSNKQVSFAVPLDVHPTKTEANKDEPQSEASHRQTAKRKGSIKFIGLQAAVKRAGITSLDLKTRTPEEEKRHKYGFYNSRMSDEEHQKEMQRQPNKPGTRTKMSYMASESEDSYCDIVSVFKSCFSCVFSDNKNTRKNQTQERKSSVDESAGENEKYQYVDTSLYADTASLNSFGL